MGAAAYVGRVGGLAVALGVGAAVATGHGVASASPDSESSSPTAAEQSSPDSSVDSDSKIAVQPKGDPADAGPSTEPSSDKTRPTVTGLTSDNLLRTAEPGQARGSGGFIKEAQTEEPDLGKKLAENVEAESVAAGVVAADEPVVGVVEEPGEEPTAESAAPGEASETMPPTTTPITDTPADDGGSKKSAALAEQPTGTSLGRIAVPPPSEVTTLEISGDTVLTPDDDADLSSGIEAIDVGDALPTTDAALVIESDDTAVVMAAASAPETPPARGTVRSVVAGFLAAIGFGPLAGSSPVAPAAPPALWALLAVARREIDRAVSSFTRILNVGSTGPVATAGPNPALTGAAAPTAAVTPNAVEVTSLVNQTRQITGWVTGPNSYNSTVPRFAIHGTDLGIMWDNGLEGDERQVLILFGDTFSAPGMTGDWRNNVLLRSADQKLEDGLLVVETDGGVFGASPLSGPGRSKQLVFGIPGTIGLFGIPSFFGSEVTMIPTAGISAPYSGNDLGARQYMNVMSVRQWGPAGMWTTNYSAIAVSDDNGENWQIDRSTIRSPGFLRTWGHSYTSGNENFQQGAFVRAPEPDANGVTWVYSYGTPSGRFGPAYVSRVPENQILNLNQYEYWNGSTWVRNNPGAATPIFGTPTGPFADVVNFLETFGLISATNNMLALFGIPTLIPRGDVSEMSVQYNEYLGKYVALYTNSSGVVMRTSDTPQGEWSDPITLATPIQYPGLYAPMIHPWSGTSQLTDDDNFLYWNLSLWGPYNVVLMETDLTQLNV